MSDLIRPNWTVVDHYLASALLHPDAALDAALASNADSGLPAIDVSPLQGKLLHLLARAVHARSVLEIGTLGGYSTIWLARAVGQSGRVITLEIDPARAEVARANLRRAEVEDRVDIRVGAALDSLPQLAREDRGPFDLVFIDADKPNNARYLDWAVQLARPGTVIICDNVVRDGDVADPESIDPDVEGARTLFNMLAADARLEATAIQTVGTKGYDGFALALVTGAEHRADAAVSDGTPSRSV